MSYRTQNPATGEVLEEFDELDDAQLREVLERSSQAFAAWRATSVDDRAKTLRKVADLYDERAEELGKAIALEMGKPVKQAIGEAKFAGMIYRWYADNGPRRLADQPLESSDSSMVSLVRREPIGIVLGIMPWNYPYYQVARFAAPNLLIGNTVLLKHAPICAKSALLMEQIFHDALAVKDAYQNIFVSNEQAAQIVEDPRVQGVSLTGSERAGAAVAEVAGRNLKKVVLELGGSDAMIILDSDDVAKMAKTAARERLDNCGQACNSPKRMMVHESIYDEFVQQLTDAFTAAKVGDPLADGTRVGPMSSAEARTGLMAQVQDAIDKGATVRTGGHAVDGPGAFMEPTVLTDITPQMRAWSEELFGPVAMVYKFSDVEDAIAQANDSSFGLSGSIWTTDVEHGAELADRLDVGMAHVNEHGASAPDLPFGGVKRSGFGRELGDLGMEEFTNKKLVRRPVS